MLLIDPDGVDRAIGDVIAIMGKTEVPSEISGRLGYGTRWPNNAKHTSLKRKGPLSTQPSMDLAVRTNGTVPTG